MDRTEATVRNMLSAIEAPLYDVGVLSDRGMLPGLDGISATTVLEKLSLLKYRNFRGSHIYIRPSGEHRYTVLDDLSAISLVKLSADGFTPCAVVETSAGNFQAWLKHRAVFPKLIGTFAAQTLASRYDADPSAADWRRFGRLPGFTNCKPKYKRPDGLFLSCSCGVTPASSTRWRKHLCRKSRSSTKLASRNGRQDACRLLFLPKGDRGYRICRWNASAPPASTTTAPPPQISPSVLPLMPMAWKRSGSNVLLRTTTSPATPALRSELPTSGEP
ncbi:RepB family DNA primase [Granulicella arctica]|uniref:RepB family DNA primase n=1 Tax=Granulicella arctica TaxID=940613 RepID=UPI0037BEE0D6